MTTGRPVGGACTSSASCAAGLSCRTTTARGDTTYPGGYCSKPCTASTECGAGNECIGGSQSTLQFYGEPNGFCAGGCPSAGGVSTCRSGYTCGFAASGTPGLCWIDPIPPFNGGAQATNTGVACTADTCQPSAMNPLLGFCFKAALPDGGSSGFTQGYCSADCGYDNTGTFCGNSATCIQLGAPPDELFVCLSKCSAPNTVSTCRSGYTCFGITQADGGTGGVCYRSCTVVGCASGTTCNTGTGQCQ